MKFQVIRPHLGDRMYNIGEEREAEPGDVAHLVKGGVLVEKSAGKAPANKAEDKPKNKGA
jgi:hypothetical protein